MQGRSQISFHEMELFSASCAAAKIHRFSTDYFISVDLVEIQGLWTAKRLANRVASKGACTLASLSK